MGHMGQHLCDLQIAVLSLGVLCVVSYMFVKSTATQDMFLDREISFNLLTLTRCFETPHLFCEIVSNLT